MSPAQPLGLGKVTLVGIGIFLILLQMSSCGGGSSSVITNAVPSLISIAPTTVTAGQAGFTLSVNGSGYLAASSVLWNGAAVSTTFVSGSDLTASIPASDVATAGVAHIQVSDPSPGGGMSTTLTLSVNNPQPSMISFAPFSATAGGASFALTLRGSNFVPASVVSWNGSARTTTFESSNQVTAAILVSDIAAPRNRADHRCQSRARRWTFNYVQI
jgi:hypothetical protein